MGGDLEKGWLDLWEPGGGSRAMWKGGDLCQRTEDENVEDQNNKPKHAAAGTVLPAVAGGCGRDVLRDGGSEGEGGQAELEEEGEDLVEHFVGG